MFYIDFDGKVRLFIIQPSSNDRIIFPLYTPTLGLKILHSATSRCRHELYIELDDFHDVRAFAKYDHFEVGSENEHFRLKSLGAYTGNAGDALHSHLNHKYVSIDVIKDGDLKVFEWWNSDGYMW